MYNYLYCWECHVIYFFSEVTLISKMASCDILKWQHFGMEKENFSLEFDVSNLILSKFQRRIYNVFFASISRLTSKITLIILPLSWKKENLVRFKS